MVEIKSWRRILIREWAWTCFVSVSFVSAWFDVFGRLTALRWRISWNREVKKDHVSTTPREAKNCLEHWDILTISLSVREIANENVSRETLKVRYIALISSGRDINNDDFLLKVKLNKLFLACLNWHETFQNKSLHSSFFKGKNLNNLNFVRIKIK